MLALWRVKSDGEGRIGERGGAKSEVDEGSTDEEEMAKVGGTARKGRHCE